MNFKKSLLVFVPRSKPSIHLWSFVGSLFFHIVLFFLFLDWIPKNQENLFVNKALEIDISESSPSITSRNSTSTQKHSQKHSQKQSLQNSKKQVANQSKYVLKNKEPQKKTAKDISKKREQKSRKSAIEKDPLKPLTEEEKKEILANVFSNMKKKQVHQESPLFLKKKDTDKDKDILEELPEEIKKTLKGSKPEPTDYNALQFTLNDYNWEFESFIKAWAEDIIYWWKAPPDYLSGKVPKGGMIWIKTILNKSGEYLEHKIVRTTSTQEMDNSALFALRDSLPRPPLPQDFPKDILIIYWRFIYLPIDAHIELKKEK